MDSSREVTLDLQAGTNPDGSKKDSKSNKGIEDEDLNIAT